ncbi:MAG: hypothetical protein KBC95_03820, partial [Candidatus Peribacteraceae bacterium]|nr:hypothetical protein [Candidatus Peribacteraceae bacterium]
MRPESQPSPSLPARGPLLWAAAFFAVLAALVYGQMLSQGFVRWDDGLLILENPIVHSLTPWSIWKAFTTYDPELYIP